MSEAAEGSSAGPLGRPTPSHYFDSAPTAGSARQQIRLDLAERSISFTTDAGVFSAQRVDPGTRVLLNEVPQPTALQHRLLDLGCGYGPIAITCALRSPQTEVLAIDINERARQLCAENGIANSCVNLEVSDPGEVDPELRFDAIWSNPPIRIGKSALHALVSTWLDRLTPQGRAWFVVQKHLGADSLATWLTANGWNTTRLASRQAYRILEIEPRDQSQLH